MLELLGLLLPIFIGMIVRHFADRDIRFIISLVLCIAVSVLVSVIETQNFLAFTSWLSIAEYISKTIMMIFGLSQFSYYFYENKVIFGMDKTLKEEIQK